MPSYIYIYIYMSVCMLAMSLCVSIRTFLWSVLVDAQIDLSISIS